MADDSRRGSCLSGSPHASEPFSAEPPYPRGAAIRGLGRLPRRSSFAGRQRGLGRGYLQRSADTNQTSQR
jgi:hypothetical protein